MNNNWNTYIFETFKMLNNLNLLETKELEISKEDLDILLAYQRKIKMFNNLNYDEYLNIIKKLSIQFLKTPVEIVVILSKNNL